MSQEKLSVALVFLSSFACIKVSLKEAYLKSAVARSAFANWLYLVSGLTYFLSLLGLIALFGFWEGIGYWIGGSIALSVVLDITRVIAIADGVVVILGAALIAIGLMLAFDNAQHFERQFEQFSWSWSWSTFFIAWPILAIISAFAGGALNEQNVEQLDVEADYRAAPGRSLFGAALGGGILALILVGVIGFF
ncbi:MAG: hypothetical protein PVF65_00240 [Sphingomonadales bacterium]|jgi:hypothetical protein